MIDKLYIERMHSTDIGEQSLIGVMGEAPYSWGNYFGLSGGPRIVNFWAENLRIANRKFKLNGMVNIREYGGQAIIADDRIPKEWYYDKLCFTGSSQPSIEVITDMMSYHGDPNNEILQFTDPKAYWDIRGYDYIERGRMYSLKKRPVEN
jgi:hypothetical protein